MIEPDDGVTTSGFEERPAVQVLCPNPDCDNFEQVIAILYGRSIEARVGCPICRSSVYIRAIVYPPSGPDDGA